MFSLSIEFCVNTRPDQLTHTLLTYVVLVQVSKESRCCIYLNTESYLKNHLAKYRLVCTHFDAFAKLILNMEMFHDSKICKKSC